MKDAKETYVLLNQHGELVDEGFTSLASAVLAAAQYDGYGAEFARDAEGSMRLYRSQRHIGNNPYRRQERDVFIDGESDLADDGEAIAAVAAEIHKKHYNVNVLTTAEYSASLADEWADEED